MRSDRAVMESESAAECVCVCSRVCVWLQIALIRQQCVTMQVSESQEECVVAPGLIQSGVSLFNRVCTQMSSLRNKQADAKWCI